MSPWVPAWSARPGAAQELRVGIRDWIESAPLSELLTYWGGAPPRDGSPRKLLAWLDAFSAEHWDHRGGRERNLAFDARLSVEQDAAALRLCPQLGLAPGRPSRERYDAVVMTGGMVRAGVVKPRFVRSLIDGGLRCDRIVFLGAHRAFAGDEHELTRMLGIGGDDEVHAMAEGMEAAFKLEGRVERSEGHGHARATTVSWPTPGLPRCEVIGAPSGAPEHRRANTADTFEYFAREAVGVASVLVVTTPIYVPYQAAVAVSTLGLGAGMSVETIGTDAASSDLGELTQPFRAQHHLQELRSAIRGFREMDSILRSAGM